MVARKTEVLDSEESTADAKQKDNELSGSELEVDSQQTENDRQVKR